MKLCQTNVRVSSSIKARVSSASIVLILVLFSIELQQFASAQQLGASVSVANAPLNVEQVVANLVGMNRERAEALHTYRGTRIYRAEYRGFPGTRSAEMVVNVKYQSPGTKEFTIQSATGSKMIIDKVFKKLLQAEKETVSAEAQRHIALNDDNYDFTLVGCECTPFGLMYVLSVEPRTKDTFLYHGRIWVDAEDFAVARLEVEPAKSPSFWTKNSEVEQVYMKVDDFWLPARNHSVTAIRFGGRAELAIQYNNYQITAADPVGSLPTREPTQSADTRCPRHLAQAAKE
jgi:hypothetical protein